VKKFDVAYFMVSVDDPETNKKFAEQEGADFPILSDPGKQVASAYGVLSPERQFASRWTFYIGKDGKILYIDKKVSPASAGADLVAKLNELGIPKKVSSGGPDTRVSADDLDRLLKEKKVFFLDVRDPKELEELGTLEGYVNIPLGQLEQRLNELPRDKAIITA
jgi:hypothetical protein